jgi:RNA polymerase sigma-70 factor (ECF subfamily)
MGVKPIERRFADVNDRPDGEMRMLMVAYQQDRVEAFDGLHDLLRPPLRRFVMLLARDAAEIDDLVQDAFLQLHRVRHTYDPAHPVLPWVFAIARNMFLMSRRTRRRRRDVDDRYRADAGSVVVRSHEEACIARSRLDDSLSTLPSGTQRAVILHHGLGLSIGEVGDSLGITTSAARVRLARAVADLRRVLEIGARAARGRTGAAARASHGRSKRVPTVGSIEDVRSARRRDATSNGVVAR